MKKKIQLRKLTVDKNTSKEYFQQQSLFLFQHFFNYYKEELKSNYLSGSSLQNFQMQVTVYQAKSVEDMLINQERSGNSQDSIFQESDSDRKNKQELQELKLDFPVQQKLNKSKFYGSLSINTTSPFSGNSFCQASSFTQYLHEHVAHSPYYQNKYEELCKLGQGAHSLCFKVRNRITDALYCAKVIRTQDHEVKMFVENEFQLLKQIECQNIVKVEEIIQIEGLGVSIIIMDFVNAPNLKKLISLGGNNYQYQILQGLPQQEILELANQLLQALNYLKTYRIIHRDIKPSNLLWDSQTKQLTVIDFGISKQLKENQQFAITPIGTANYKAPEIINESDYNEQIDIWGTGIIDLVDQQKELTFAEDVPIQLQELIRSMLSVDPNKRPTPKQALTNTLFNGLATNHNF